jgi:hypothetical protein
MANQIPFKEVSAAALEEYRRQMRTTPKSNKFNNYISPERARGRFVGMEWRLMPKHIKDAYKNQSSTSNQQLDEGEPGSSAMERERPSTRLDEKSGTVSNRATIITAGPPHLILKINFPDNRWPKSMYIRLGASILVEWLHGTITRKCIKSYFLKESLS